MDYEMMIGQFNTATMPRMIEYLETDKKIVYNTKPDLCFNNGNDIAVIYEGVIEKELKDRYVIVGSKCLAWREALKCQIGATIFFSEKEALLSVKDFYDHLCKISTYTEEREQKVVNNYKRTLALLEEIMPEEERRKYLECSKEIEEQNDGRKYLWYPEKPYDEKKQFIFKVRVLSEDTFKYVVDKPEGMWYDVLYKDKLNVDYFPSFDEAYDAYKTRLQERITRYEDSYRYIEERTIFYKKLAELVDKRLEEIEAM